LHCAALKLQTWSNFLLFNPLKPEEQCDSASLFYWSFDFGNCMAFLKVTGFRPLVLLARLDHLAKSSK
jgi:hypothetical protein